MTSTDSLYVQATWFKTDQLEIILGEGQVKNASISEEQLESPRSLAVAFTAGRLSGFFERLFGAGTARNFWILLSFLIVLTTIGCGNFKSQTKIVRAAAAESAAIQLGDTGRVGNFAVTVVGVHATNARDDLVKDVSIRVPDPAEGNVYILIDVNVKNIGDEFEVISSRQQINLFDADHETQKWSLIPISKGAIDGRIDPGRERHGELVWEVDEHARDLTLAFGETVFAIGDASGFRPGSSE